MFPNAKFFSAFFFASVFTLICSAQSVNPNFISCHDDVADTVPNFIELIKSNDGFYFASNETTYKYLIGLKCKFSNKSAFVFSCRTQDDQVSFFSQQIVEKTVDVTTGLPTETDQLKITMYYYYKNNQGQYTLAQSVRQFLTSNCQTN